MTSNTDPAAPREAVRASELSHRCHCCGTPATHVGKSAGIVLMAGCKWSARKWAQTGIVLAPIPMIDRPLSQRRRGQ